MSVALPVLPRGAVVTPRLVRVSGDLASPLGGPTQRITRIGSRYAVGIELPPLDAVCAGRWLSVPLLAEARGDTLLLTMPQMIEPPLGAATGSGAAGTDTIAYVGPTPISPGTWFSFTAGGRNYLHLVTGAPTVGSLTISPLLRVAMPAATHIEFAAPKLEGFPDDTSWSLEWFRFVGHTFTLTENA